MKNQHKKSNFLIGAIFFVLVFLSPNFNNGHVLAAESSERSKQELKNKIDALRSQIEKYQQDIYQKNQKEESISNDIEVLEADIKKIELQVQETELLISQLNLEINAKQLEVQDMQKKVDERRVILSKFLQSIYERADNATAGIIFGSQSFSDYFFQAESLESFEDQAKEVFDQLVILRDSLKQQKNDLMKKREDKENMRYIQVDQENSLKQEREMKDLLISKIQNEKEALTQGMEKMQAELSVLQSLGEPIGLAEAVKSAKYASNLTKVAPEFLLGVLRVESGLGTNVGGGRYKTDMNPAQWTTFKSICKDLGIDPDKTPVSRRACYNRESSDGCGGWGGAMGPAQFMPSTWMGYKSKVEKTTGEVPANPWDIKDSLVAMGLKLAAVDGVTSGDRKAWAKAAGMYLAGGNWENYPWYSDRVLFYADSFKKIIKDY